MENFLLFLVIIFGLIVVFSLINERLFKMPEEVALLLFSVIVGVGISIVTKVNSDIVPGGLSDSINTFRIDKVLLDAVLCFMLFSGASELKLPNLVHNFKPISLLALLTTVIASALYGCLFWCVTKIIGINMSFTLCFLLGSIVSPTDPIAATSILNKMGLSKNTTAIMEGESLFNDGTGVALFIFIRDLYLDTKGSNFFVVMCKELFGALVVGMAISFVFFFLIKATKDPIKHIIISMLSVALAYTICEHFGFSGVIASVVCGIYFSTMMDKHKALAENKDLDPLDYYKDFWSIVDKLLNYSLYVMIGLSFVYVRRVKWFVVIALAAIVINFVARFIGVYISSAICRQVPDGHTKKSFTMLMTWSGLKGGLCLALAMSTVSYMPTESYDVLLLVSYVTILFTTIVQGLTVGGVYNYIKNKLANK